MAGAGLVPILLIGAWWYRRRRRKRKALASEATNKYSTHTADDVESAIEPGANWRKARIKFKAATAFAQAATYMSPESTKALEVEVQCARTKMIDLQSAVRRTLALRLA